jgi:hypothetical protein
MAHGGSHLRAGTRGDHLFRREIPMTTLTARRTLVQTFLIKLRRFLDAVLKPDSRDDAAGPFHWGRGL